MFDVGPLTGYTPAVTMRQKYDHMIIKNTLFPENKSSEILPEAHYNISMIISY